MVSIPKTCPATTTVAQVRDDFQNDHVHCVLIVDGSVLLAVIERPDIADARPEARAVSLGRLHHRVISPGEALEQARVAMLDQGRRRLAVVDDRGSLLGLLCLKRTGLGFCADTDVRARAAERAKKPRPSML
jgi:CBS domain-containing protein